ncbi:hypothetical protein [Polyangium sp. y55x31]|uniref:hypothetical protein n=1 Tax=Polyangium sp. y55x31 TaxID=3042688 RepID=UPI0024830C99|nr:hypothetical protein [Polyangium sp. y55x31]MDI1484281.1 hypothetical protein [Polyangium sp. y55x31]
MLSRRALLGSGLGFAGSLLLSRPALAKKTEKEPIPALPLSFAVAEEDGVPVQNETWIAEQITEATRLFTPIGVTLRKTNARALPPALARLETRADRDALAAHLEAKRINVMIVASLRDVDDPKLFRMGVHWRHRKMAAKHWVIVAASARPSTLAHELGHFFGLGHSDVTDNVMSYSRTGAVPPFFDAKQAERIESMARMYVGSKLLEPA